MLSSKLNSNLNLKLLKGEKEKRCKVIEGEAFIVAKGAEEKGSDFFSFFYYLLSTLKNMPVRQPPDYAAGKTLTVEQKHLNTVIVRLPSTRI